MGILHMLIMATFAENPRLKNEEFWAFIFC